MTTGTMRKIVNINEELCNGCGACVVKCAESALKIIDGKAKLVSDIYCDGLGACLGECPEGAITIEERPAAAFDEEAVEKLQHEQKHHEHKHHDAQHHAEAAAFQGCPSARLTEMMREETVAEAAGTVKRQSTLRAWPVQLTLVPPKAPFLAGADVLLAAHCAPFAYADFHQDFLKDHALLIACPKLDDVDAHLQKLTEIVQQSSLKSITVARMEVPCCGGLTWLAEKAIEQSGRDIPLNEVVISIRGEARS